MNLVYFLFFTLLLIFIPLFCVFVQTIKNLIAFVFLIFLISINLMLFFSIEFFPIFFMLIYIGAIIVTTLFMVLTFDLRSEYASKKTFEPKALFNMSLYFFSSFFIFTLVTYLQRTLWKNGSLGELERIQVYTECMATRGIEARFCANHFGKTAADRGFYHTTGENINDITIIADHLYTTYAPLFILLGVILTIALLAALSILKK